MFPAGNGMGSLVIFNSVFSTTKRSKYIDPPGKDETPWRFEGHQVRLMGDGANAQAIAGENVWNKKKRAREREENENDDDDDETGEESYFKKDMCAWHAGPHWFDKKKHLLKNLAHEERVRANFESFKKCASVDVFHRKFLMDKMLDQWISAMGEAVFAEAFKREWYNCTMSRAEINGHKEQQVKGGNVCDNNGVEATNSSYKHHVGNTKPPLRTSVGSLVNYLNTKSIGDLSFGERMYDCTNKNHVHDVTSAKFMAHVYRIENLSVSPYCKALTKNLTITDSDNNKSSVKVIPSVTKILEKLNTGYDDIPALEPYTEAHVKTAMKDWYKTWKKVFYYDADHGDASVEGMNFETICETVSWFHVLTPITDKRYLELLITRLNNAGWTTMSYEEVIELEETLGWCQCSCPCFRHTTFCTHVAVDARKKRLLTSWPTALNPTRMGGQTGRPSHSLQGGALGRN